MNKTMGAILGVGIMVIGGAWLWASEFQHEEPGHDHGHEHGHDHEHSHDRALQALTAKEPVRADGAFTITTSFYPLAFALERIAGDLAEVSNVGAGRDPHDFRPSTQDIVTLQQSDLVVLHGADFEPWGERVQAQLQDEGVPVVLATAELELMEAGAHDHDHGQEHDEEDDETHHEDGHRHTGEADEYEEAHAAKKHEDEHDHEHGDYDPHTWLDPILMSDTVAYLTEVLVTLDPENASTYTENAAALEAELAELHEAYEDGLATCATDEVITSHDAFGYVAERYDVSIHAIAGLSTQDSPSAQTLATLRAEAAEGVNAILLEESSVTAYGETLAAETGLETLRVNPIAYVIPAGEDYFSLMRANLETFKTALVCNG